MKNVLVFLFGTIFGIAISTVSYRANVDSSTVEADTISEEYVEPAPSQMKGVTLFDEPDGCVSTNRLEVFQVLDSGDALAGEQLYVTHDFYRESGLIVLILKEEGKHYYDKQIIKVPRGKCFKQIGLYKYAPRYEREKTVPIVSLLKK